MTGRMITVNWPPDLADSIVKIAQVNRASVSWVIRRLCSDAIADPKDWHRGWDADDIPIVLD